MDKNSLVAFLGGVGIAGLVTFGTVCVLKGMDGIIIGAVTGSLGAIIGAVAVYLKGATAE